MKVLACDAIPNAHYEGQRVVPGTSCRAIENQWCSGISPTSSYLLRLWCVMLKLLLDRVDMPIGSLLHPAVVDNQLAVAELALELCQATQARERV